MSDNRQVAFLLALIAGVLALVGTAAFMIFMGGVGMLGGHAFDHPWRFDVPGYFGLIGLLGGLLGLVGGILLLVASGRLKEDSPDTRRTWAVVCIVVGALHLVAFHWVVGGLALGAGVVTMSDLNRTTPRAPAP